MNSKKISITLEEEISEAEINICFKKTGRTYSHRIVDFPINTYERPDDEISWADAYASLYREER